jgi:uncharacterized protein
MIIRVKVKPNSSKQSVESENHQRVFHNSCNPTGVEFGADRYLVHVKSEPENDKANIEMIKLLSKNLGIPENSFHIKFGRTSNEKIIEVRF